MASEDFDNVRLKTPGGIFYKRVEGYPSFDYEEGMGSAEDEIIIESEMVTEFLEESIPAYFGGESVRDSKTGLITIKLPSVMPGSPELTIRRVHVEPLTKTKPFDPYNFDSALGSAKYETYSKLARVHLWYETTSRDFFREVQVSIGAEYLQVGPNKANVDANGTPLDPNNTTGQSQSQYSFQANKDNTLAGYKYIPTAEWTYNLQPFANPDWETYFTMLGRVNDRKSTLLCENSIEETVMFTGVAATRTNTGLATSPNWNVGLKFSQRHITEGGDIFGWNHVYCSSKGKWVQLTRADTGRFLYEKSDLSTLLTATVS